jgi:hypothetical protein
VPAGAHLRSDRNKRGPLKWGIWLQGFANQHHGFLPREQRHKDDPAVLLSGKPSGASTPQRAGPALSPASDGG